MSKTDIPTDVYVTVVGQDELQRLTVTRFPAGPDNDAFFGSLGPSDYWNNLLLVVVDARQLLAEIMGVLPDVPPDPNKFDAFSGGWYAATCWGYADALLLRDDASLEHKLAWSQMLGAIMTEWDWRLHYKGHIVRGAKTEKAASEGGKAKSRGSATRNKEIIDYMKPLLAQHSVSRAASLAHTQGKLGTSAVANRKLWERHPELRGDTL
jgi:hypothetical protein